MGRSGAGFMIIELIGVVYGAGSPVLMVKYYDFYLLWE